MKILLIIVLTYYALKFIARKVFPSLIKNYMQKMQNQYTQQDTKQPENINIGETVIDKKTKTTTSNQNVGEYVDFEEVE